MALQEIPASWVADFCGLRAVHYAKSRSGWQIWVSEQVRSMQKLLRMLENRVAQIEDKKG
jgi:hypothetical protein